MGRKKHPAGRAGTWIEVKVIKGRTYWYERTRVYLGTGQLRIDSKYLGPGPKRTPENAAAQLHESANAHGQNQSPEQKESVAHKAHRLWDRLKNPACGLVDNASEDSNKGVNPKSADHDGGQPEPLTLVTNRQK